MRTELVDLHAEKGSKATVTNHPESIYHSVARQDISCCVIGNCPLRARNELG
jgi:hypothetical protein